MYDLFQEPYWYVGRRRNEEELEGHREKPIGQGDISNIHRSTGVTKNAENRSDRKAFETDSYS